MLWDNGCNDSKENTFDGQANNLAAPLLKGETGIAKRVFVQNPLLRRPLEYSDPDFRPMCGSPALQPAWSQPPDDGFFDQWAHWLGAFGTVDWTEAWTSFLQEQDIRIE